MVSQGFFSGSADRKKRMAGSSDTKVALGGDNLGSMGGIGAVIGVGALGIKGIQSAVEGGKRLRENIQKRINPEEDNKQSFFSPRLNEVKVATTGNLPSDYTRTEDDVNFDNYIQKNFKDNDLDYGIKSFLRENFKNEEGGYDAPYKLDRNPLKYREGSFLNTAKDTKIAQSDFDENDFQTYAKTLGIKRPGQLPPTMIRMLKQNYMDDKKELRYKDGQLFNKAPEGNIFTRTAGSIFNTLTGTQSVAAGTLDDNQTRFAGEADPTPRPKLDYVNPDKTTMTGSEIRDAFKPSNLFGYKDKFGRYGEAVDRDRQQTINQVAQRYSSMPNPDARSLSQIRADRAAKMKDDAKARQAAFKETGVQTFGGKVQPQKSADVTYGTNMLSNPAFGFRSKMKPEDQKKYDKSARDATEMARPDPSIGNVIAQTINRVSGLVGGPQMSLESIGERQLRLANKEVNRPSYQKEAFARNQLGITIGDLRARNMQIIRQNAAARNQAFKTERAIKAAEKSAKRLGGNIGTGRDGGFGTGTEGKGMPSNPKGFSGYSRPSSKSTSKSQGRGGRRGGSTGGSGSSSKGGTGGGQSRSGGTTGRTASKASKSRTGRSRSQCDIRTKIDIAPLTNPDLIRDDLANVAYFVKEIK